MKFGVLYAFALLLGACASGSQESPVEKVVNLLTELKTQIEADETQEQAVYDKYACWCEKTTQRKAEAIEAAKMTLRQTGNEILKLKGTIATRAAEIEKLVADIKENEDAQKMATEIRQKENAEFMAESTEMKQALAAIFKANTVLGQATGAGKTSSSGEEESGSSLLQGRMEAASSVSAAISSVPAKTLARMPTSKLSLLRQYATELAKHKSDSKYQPQSATIQGILSDMYETFSSDLEITTIAESSKNRDYEAYIATKQEELLIMQASLKLKTQEKAEAEVMLAEATQMYDDVSEQMKADVEFFDTTTKACTAKADEWTERKALRAEELEGITKALEILSSDEARELFDKSIKPGYGNFMQVASDENEMAPAVKNAFQLLKKVSAKSHSLRLAKLAVAVRTAKVGHFDRVLEAIDTIIATLKGEFKEDIEKRDQCKDEYQKINSTISDLNWKITNNQARIEKLEALIAQREAERLKTIEEIEAVNQTISDMETQRIAENQEFVTAKKDDQDAIALLQQAKDYLQEYYKKHGLHGGAPAPAPAAAFLQAAAPAGGFEVSPDQAPDATFSHKGKRSLESKGVISIIDMIIEDLGGEIKTSMKTEEEAQLLFEKQLAAAKELRETLQTKKVNLEDTIALRNTEKTEEEEKKTANEGDRTEEETYKEEIKPDCDWIIDNFKERTEKRTAELDALVQAKAYLAGYQDSQESSASLLAKKRPSLRKGALQPSM